MFPLRATHESQHDWHAFAIGPVDHGVVGDLQLPAKQVETEILGVTHDGRIAHWIISEEQIGRIDAAANQIVPAVDLQIEVTARANFRKARVGITPLGDLANTEIDRLRVGTIGLPLTLKSSFR